MSFEELMTAIQTFGFPIVCAIALGWFCSFIIKKIMAQNEEREKLLYKKIDECQEINKAAIETIASYAEKLETIEDNVTEIKNDVLVIKTKFEK